MANLENEELLVESPALEIIRTRRVVREFTGEPVTKQHIHKLLEAARWAPSAGNRRIHKFLVIRNEDTVAQIRTISPGILGNPNALIVICTDEKKAEQEGVRLVEDTTTWIDVGTAAQNIMLAAHALGLGACPLTSFSKGAIRTVAELPPFLIPEFIIQLGHPTSRARSRVIRSGTSTRLSIKELAYWERYPNRLPA